MNSTTSKKGFTLIELLMVVAIISLLSSVVLANIVTVRSKARNTFRKQSMKQIQNALELYRLDNGSYPSTSGNWLSSEPGDQVTNNSGDYVPGLVPKYMTSLPRDPLGGASLIQPNCGAWRSAILYRSNDGTGFDLIAHCSPEGSWTSSDIFYDSDRPTWAWEICVAPDCND